MRDCAPITVGYDGSRCARRAVEWAAQQADDHHAAVLAVACYSLPIVEPWYISVAVDVNDVRNDAQGHLDDVVATVRRTYPTVSFATRVELGPAAERLIEAGRESAVLVVGSHGHGPLDAWRLGSVSHAVARRARCPVVVVPDVEPRPRRDRVVVGVDGSQASYAALRWACDEADDRDAELVVAHVWDYPYTIAAASMARDVLEVDAALHLEEATRAARDRRRGPTKDVLLSGSTPTELIGLSEEADLLVVGSRGRNAVRTLLFGSVSQTVSARSACPVVIVREGDVVNPRRSAGS